MKCLYKFHKNTFLFQLQVFLSVLDFFLCQLVAFLAVLEMGLIKFVRFKNVFWLRFSTNMFLLGRMKNCFGSTSKQTWTNIDLGIIQSWNNSEFM